MLHIGTNDALKCASVDIAARILKLKEWIKTKLLDCKVIISLPIRPIDHGKANKVIADVNEKLREYAWV